MNQLLIAAQKCGQCLTTRNRIVSGERAAAIVRDCRKTQTHFFCHKAPSEKCVHCRGVHEIVESRAYKMAAALGIPIIEVDPDSV